MVVHDMKLAYRETFNVRNSRGRKQTCGARTSTPRRSSRPGVHDTEIKGPRVKARELKDPRTERPEELFTIPLNQAYIMTI
jgi:hypothetical protein